MCRPSPIRPLATTTILLAMAIGCGACGPNTPSAESQAVSAAFGAYQAALRGQQGSAAAMHIGPKTAQRYEALRAAALSADKAALDREPVGTRVLVLIARATFSPAALQRLDGAGLFAASVTAGLMDPMTAQITLTDVHVDGDGGRARLVIDGTEVPQQLALVRTAGGPWTFELTALMAAVEDSLAAITKQLEMPVDTWVLQTVAARTGLSPTPTWWTPPVPALQAPPEDG